MITAQPAPVRLYVVRHGETAWSLSGRHTGRTDMPLTAHGQNAARALQRYLGGIPFLHAISSPSQRARRTWELARPDLAAEIDPDLMEWDYGDYEGSRTEDIRKDRPGWSVFRDGCPGGETPAQVSARAGRIIARFGAKKGNIALFTHGQFACALAARWIGMPVAEGVHFLSGAASISILGENPVHPDVRVIALWNFVPQSPLDER